MSTPPPVAEDSSDVCRISLGVYGGGGEGGHMDSNHARTPIVNALRSESCSGPGREHFAATLWKCTADLERSY